MTIYLVQLALIFVLDAFFHPETDKTRRRLFYILVFLLLVIVSGMRGYSVGVDTHSYVRVYNSIARTDIANLRFELLFSVYLKTLHFFSSDPRLLIVVSSVICVGSYCYFAYRFSKISLLSLLLYITLDLYFSQMNIMRQAISMSIIMIAFSLILDNAFFRKRKWLSILISGLLILMAIGFHSVAIVALIPWFILIRTPADKEEFSLQNTLLWIVVLSLFVFVFYSLIMWISSVLFASEADYYFNSIFSDSNYFGSLLNVLVSVSFLTVGAIALRGRVLDRMQRFGLIMLGANLIFLVLSMRMEIWERIAGLFSAYTALIWVPEFMSVIENRNNYVIIKWAIILLTFTKMIVILVFRPEWTGVVPYVIG